MIITGAGLIYESVTIEEDKKINHTKGQPKEAK